MEHEAAGLVEDVADLTTQCLVGDIRPWSSWQSEVSGELTIILAVVRNNKDIGPASPSMKQILKVLKTRSERQI